MNAQPTHRKGYDPHWRERLAGMMRSWAQRQNPPASMDDAFAYLDRILPLIQTRIRLLSDIPDQVDFFFLEVRPK